MRENLEHDGECEQKRGDPCRCVSRHRAKALTALIDHVRTEARVETLKAAIDTAYASDPMKGDICAELETLAAPTEDAP